MIEQPRSAALLLDALYRAVLRLSVPAADHHGRWRPSTQSRFPSVYPWVGFDARLVRRAVERPSGCGQGLWNTLWVGVAVVALSVPIGTAAAILINSLHSRARGRCSTGDGRAAPDARRGHRHLDAAVLEPPGRPGGPASCPCSARSSFIAAYVMLLVLARLQSFDPRSRRRRSISAPATSRCSAGSSCPI